VPQGPGVRRGWSPEGRFLWKADIINMPFSLLQLSREQLLECADSRQPSALASRVEEGALPPSFVAARALQLIAEGKAEFWCNTFLIVRNRDQRITTNARTDTGDGPPAAARRREAVTPH
jgi:hypothetical protein